MKKFSVIVIFILAFVMVYSLAYAAKRPARDRTGDNLGNTAPPVILDADFDGYISTKHGGDDCNDHNAAIHPGAVEICGNQVDENCDGNIEACPCIDEDGDGYGENCALGDDCDDTNPEINPEMPEICGDNIDQDCSGEDLACVACPIGNPIPQTGCACAGNNYYIGYCCEEGWQFTSCDSEPGSVTINPSTPTSLNEGQTYTITGSGFGTKTHPAPLLYDTITNIPQYEPFNLQHGDVIPTNGGSYPIVDCPDCPWHNRCGAPLYYDNSHNRLPGQPAYKAWHPTQGNVKGCLGKNFNLPDEPGWTYLSYYWRASHDFWKNSSVKMYRMWSSGIKPAYSSLYGYYHSYNDVCGEDIADHDSLPHPLLGTWHRSETLWYVGPTTESSKAWHWRNGKLYNERLSNGICAYDGKLDYLNKIGYDTNNDGAWMNPNIELLFGEIYFDDSPARVFISESPDHFSASEEVYSEIQMPSAWTNSEITFNAQHKALVPGQQYYLYVVNGNNEHSEGYPITFTSACNNNLNCSYLDQGCTIGVCSNGFCQAQASTAACDDGNVCTINDMCNAGTCAGSPNSGAVCDDFLGCTGNDRCTAQGQCQGTTFDNGLCPALTGCGQAQCGLSGCTYESCTRTDSLSSHLTFEGNLNDSSQNGNHALCVDNCPPYTAGHNGQGLRYQQNYEYIWVPVATDQPFSLSMWVYSNHATGSHPGLVSFPQWFSLHTQRYGHYLFFTRTTDEHLNIDAAFTGCSMPENQWRQVTLTYDGATLRVYVNGSACGQTALAPISRPLDFAVVGNIYWRYYAQSGVIDDVMVFDETLTPERAAEAYIRGPYHQ